MDGYLLEATCNQCGETFNPSDPGDTEHLERDDGTECGGLAVATDQGDFTTVAHKR